MWGSIQEQNVETTASASTKTTDHREATAFLEDVVEEEDDTVEVCRLSRVRVVVEIEMVVVVKKTVVEVLVVVVAATDAGW